MPKPKQLWVSSKCDNMQQIIINIANLDAITVTMTEYEDYMCCAIVNNAAYELMKGTWNECHEIVNTVIHRLGIEPTKVEEL